MYNLLFVLGMALLLTPVFIWSFRSLPLERWQIICVVPIRKRADGSWQGLNLTYYGLFNAVSLCAAVALVFILTAAAGVELTIFTAIVTVLLAFCLPASRILARWVEKKPNTFSIGAASFLGIVLGPWLVLAMEKVAERWMSIDFDTMAVMSALLIGYAMGEGIGRLACISFGCCYGKPMDLMPSWIRRHLAWATFRFIGGTKKIAYAHDLEGKPIFAVQAVTAVLYSVTSLAGTALFLSGKFAWAFFLCLLVTQGWRFLSEFLRSDYRGDRKISVYQIMSLLTIPYGLLIPLLLPITAYGIDLQAGLRAVWNPAVMLFLQVAWVVMFLRTGRSQVTGSGISFHVNHDRI
jgi:hypothetical protein